MISILSLLGKMLQPPHGSAVMSRPEESAGLTLQKARDARRRAWPPHVFCVVQFYLRCLDGTSDLAIKRAALELLPLLAVETSPGKGPTAARCVLTASCALQLAPRSSRPRACW